jgi:hypothetical protein
MASVLNTLRMRVSRRVHVWCLYIHNYGNKGFENNGTISVINSTVTWLFSYRTARDQVKCFNIYMNKGFDDTVCVSVSVRVHAVRGHRTKGSGERTSELHYGIRKGNHNTNSA